MTIRFVDKLEFGFNVFGGIAGGNGLNNRKLKTYKVTAANNTSNSKTNACSNSNPSGLSKAKGWSIKGKFTIYITIYITTGVPCAVAPNFPKPYAR